MKTDKIILAQDYALEGEVGRTRPNDNVVVVGSSGAGKSLSLEYPTMLAVNKSSLIATFAKFQEAMKMSAVFRDKGYKVLLCNLDDPGKGNIFFDPIKYLGSFDDIASLSNQIVYSVLKKSNDDYWNSKATALLGGLIAGTLMVKDTPSFSDVLEMFDSLTVEEHESGSTNKLNNVFQQLKKYDSHCYAVREYFSFKSLPEKTASCVRDTLAAALSTVFSESVRRIMKSLPSVSFEKLATEKTALFLIVSPIKSPMHNFANLIYDSAIKSLLAFAQERTEGRLPRPVKLFFDDFACSAPIQSFPQQISIFRAAGLSAMLLLQSESQLQAIYGEENSTTILNNCATYIYFPGGMDLKTCRNVSQKMNLPLDEVLYAPMGQVFIMQAGKKPVIRNRYDIMHDPMYLAMLSKSTISDKAIVPERV